MNIFIRNNTLLYNYICKIYVLNEIFAMLRGEGPGDQSGPKQGGEIDITCAH